MMKVYYNEDGWVCQRYPYDIPITDESRFIEVEDDSITFCADKYFAWRVVDGKLEMQQYETKVWSVDERESERRTLHKNTDEDYAKYSRQVRMNIDKEHSQAILDYIDEYNLEVSNTVYQAGFPLEVVYPEYKLP